MRVKMTSKGKRANLFGLLVHASWRQLPRSTCNTVVTNARCIPNEVQSVKKCSAEIFGPKSFVPLVAYLCSQSTIEFITNKYFVGEEKLDKVGPSIEAITAEECRELLNNKRSATLGALIKTSSNNWSTQNEANIQYKWMQTLRFRETNLFIRRTKIYYNIFNGDIVADEFDKGQCHAAQEKCQCKEVTMIWKHRPNSLCNYIMRRSVHNGTIKVHYRQDEIEKIDISEIGIEFKNFIKTNSNITRCFSNESTILQTFHNFIINLNDCKDLKKSEIGADDLVEPDDLEVGERMNFLSTKMSALIAQVENQIHLMNCRLSSEFQFYNNLLARLFPSRILTRMINKETAAIWSNDVIQQLSCTRHTVQLLPSLEYGERFATRPLGKINLANSSVLLQWTDSEYWSSEIMRSDSRINKGIMSFKIGENFISYMNGTLMETNPLIQTLKHVFNDIPLRIPSFDFTEFDRKVNKVNKNTEVTSIHDVIAWIKLKQDVLERGQTASGNDEGHYYALTRLSTPFGHINSSFFVIIHFIIQILTHIYTTIWTILIILATYWYCCHSRRANNEA